MDKTKYQIIFVDIDWTILNHNIGDWDYDSLEVLKKLQSQGVLVYLNTARPYDSIIHTDLLDIFTPDGIACTSGGVVFIKDKILYANVIPEAIVREIEEIADRHHLVLELATTKERHFTAPANEYVHRYFSVFREVIPTIKKYENEDVSAILLFAPEEYDEVLLKELPKETNYLRFDSCGVDVGYHENSKGKAIKAILKHLNIDRENAVAVGDSNDDISMFKEVGLSIAMGNGKVEAQNEANIVCDTIDNHGLAKELIEIFDLK